MELFIHFLNYFPRSPHRLHGYDLSTKTFATPNFPPIYGKPADMYILGGRILIPPFPFFALLFSDHTNYMV